MDQWLCEYWKSKWIAISDHTNGTQGKRWWLHVYECALMYVLCVCAAFGDLTFPQDEYLSTFKEAFGAAAIWNVHYTLINIYTYLIRKF